MMRALYFVLMAVILACVTFPATGTATELDARPAGLCQVCTYVIENKQRRQPYLCRGLKDPNYQKYCARVLESLMWWMENEVYWMNYGCEQVENGTRTWIRPCPAAAICSWLKDFEVRETFCPLDPAYPTPA